MAIILDEKMSEYHENPALSNSKINTYREDGPYAYFRRFIEKTMEDKDTDALNFGRIFDDKLFLDHPLFDKKYVVRPQGIDLRTKEGKAWLLDAGDREHITPKENELIEEMAAAIYRNDFAREALNGGKSQVTVRRPLPALGVTLQARPDYLKRTATTAYLVDVKTTVDLESYIRNANDYGYPRQLAIGQFLLAAEGIQTEGLQVVVEKKIAGRCRVFRFSETILAASWETVKHDITAIAACMKSGDWSDQQKEIIEVAVPRWSEQKLMRAAEA